MIASERMSERGCCSRRRTTLAHHDVVGATRLRALSTTFFIPEGARNWPFLMFTGFPARATAWMKSVCRQRNAGVCSVHEFATVGTSSSVNVGEHRHVQRSHLGEDLEPFSMPAAERSGLRFALSYDDLKMKNAQLLVISWSWPATSICSCSLDDTGPAIRKNGLSDRLHTTVSI
jgi:hypothetical protein